MIKSTLRASVFVFVMGISFAICANVEAQERTWRDKTGKFEVVAELVEVVGGKAVLKKQNGKTIKVPVNKFCDVDIAYLKSLNSPPPAENPPAEQPKSPPKPEPKTEPIAPPKSEPKAEPIAPPKIEPKVEPKAPPMAEPKTPPTQPRTLPPKKEPTRPPVKSTPLEPKTTPALPPANPPPSVNVQPEKIKPAIPKPAKAPAVVAQPLKLVDRTGQVIQEISVPDTPVSEADIAALSGELATVGQILNSNSSSAEIRDALDTLEANWPGQNPTIIKLVRKASTCDEKFCRLKAIRLLGKHSATESFPFILSRLDDTSQEVRWTVINLIQSIKDPRALKPLVDRFAGKERAKISTALMAYGTEAESQLYYHLRDRRAEVRMETSLLLGKLGSEKSLPYLQQLAAGDPNPVVALQAKSAIRNINKRTEEAKTGTQPTNTN